MESTHYRRAYRLRSFFADFEKYLEKKRRKIGNGSFGSSRAQRELISQILKRFRKMKKKYK